MEDLSDSLYDTVVVATNKRTKRRDTFYDKMQHEAEKPISLRALIEKLFISYKPPRTKKDPEMVIRVRTRDAYTRFEYLRRA
jgi:hypothetical protein